MDLVKFGMTIGGKKVNVTTFAPNTASSKSKEVITHYKLLIDRSGSMGWTLGQLMDQVQKTVDVISKKDLISVGWFSGLGQYGTICQGIHGGENIKPVLDKFRNTVGLTCFSESVAHAIDPINTFKDVVDQTVVILFTDGCPVVGWSVEEETKRCLEVINKMKNDLNVSAFNTIGYGNYYNRTFLQTLSEATDQGMFVHSMDINKFLDQFTETVNVAKGLVLQSLDITSSDTEADVLYVGNGTLGLHQGDLSMRRIDKDKNLVYIISEDAKNEVTVNGEAGLPVKKVKQSEIPAQVEDFLYSYASALFYRGERQKALDIVVNNLRDKAIADKMMNVFTVAEVAAAQELLTAANKDPRKRYLDGKCGAGYLPRKDAFCLMDLFNIFFDKDETAYYVPFSKNVDEYARIGRKVTDEYNAFVWSDKEVIAPLKDFVWNKEHLNLSIRFVVDGIVELNPRSAKSVGLDSKYPSIIYRNHTFVKDGQLNIKAAELIVSDKVLEVLTKNKINTRILSTGESVNGILLNRVVVDLSSIPVINRLYVDSSDSLDDLKAIVVRIASNEAGQKVTKELLNNLLENNVTLRKTGAYKGLNAAQIAVLEEHGISDKGVYGGIANVKPKAEDSDFYLTRTMEFYLKGCSSLPSIKDFWLMVEGKKKINVPGKMMVDYYNGLVSRLKAQNLDLDKPNTAVRDFLYEELDNIKDEIASDRQHVNAIKLAKTLTNDFFHGLVADDKGGYSYGDENHTMILRTDYTKEYV